jgi:hypothetical protein
VNSDEAKWVNTTIKMTGDITKDMDLKAGYSKDDEPAAKADAKADKKEDAKADKKEDAKADKKEDTKADADKTTPADAKATDAAAADSLVQKHRNRKAVGNTKDIAESDVDPWVYDMVAPNVEQMPLGRQAEAPKVNNYWENAVPAKEAAVPTKAPASFISTRGNTHDIAESNVDPWVYDAVSASVEYAPLGRQTEAPKADNYWDNAVPAKAPASFISTRGNNKDIAESHVDPWVYDKVAPNVEWAPLGRPKEGPNVDNYWENVQDAAK